jgi:hypothetical protein
LERQKVDDTSLPEDSKVTRPIQPGGDAAGTVGNQNAVEVCWLNKVRRGKHRLSSVETTLVADMVSPAGLEHWGRFLYNNTTLCQTPPRRRDDVQQPFL